MSQDKVYLTYILECLSNIEELTQNGRDALEADKHHRAALLYYLQTLAETTQRLSEKIKATQVAVDWVGISGFRNRLVHGYMQVNMEIVWNVVENYVPELKQAAVDMLKKLDEEE